MKQAVAKYTLALILSGVIIAGSSFKKTSFANNSQSVATQKHSVSIKGKFAITLVENGVEGTGEGSHLGRFTLVAHDDEEGFPVITGMVTITAANGDELFATHTGFAQELGNGKLQVDFVNTITGGTGKFAGATGSFDIHALVNENIGKGAATFDGTVNY